LFGHINEYHSDPESPPDTPSSSESNHIREPKRQYYGYTVPVDDTYLTHVGKGAYINIKQKHGGPRGIPHRRPGWKLEL
jgi:hypothetical protein